MISIKELLSGNDFDKLPEEHKKNLEKLLTAINIIRSNYGKPMIVTSGYRSLEHHLKIYADKGITDPKKIPMKSKHLSGCACDITDSKGELYQWAKNHDSILAHAGLWCEEGTKGWVHFQILPPASKKRWFLP